MKTIKKAIDSYSYDSAKFNKRIYVRKHDRHYHIKLEDDYRIFDMNKAEKNLEWLKDPELENEVRKAISEFEKTQFDPYKPIITEKAAREFAGMVLDELKPNKNHKDIWLYNCDKKYCKGYFPRLNYTEEYTDKTGISHQHSNKFMRICVKTFEGEPIENVFYHKDSMCSSVVESYIKYGNERALKRRSPSQIRFSLMKDEESKLVEKMLRNEFKKLKSH